MAGPFDNFSKFAGGGAKAPSSSKGSTGQNALIAYMLGQQKGQGLQQQLGEGAIPIEGTDKGTGAKYVNLQNKLKEKGVDTYVDVSKKQTQDLDEKYGQAGRMIGALKNLYGFAQNIEQEFENPITGNKGAGSVAQIASDFSGGKYVPGFIKKQARPLSRYKAQMQEVKISALPILSGQARYVVDLARAIQDTIPNVGDPIELKRDLIAQTTRNMMTLTYAIENGQVGPEQLRRYGIDPEEGFTSGDVRGEKLLRSVQLTPEQEQSIDAAIQDVLGAQELGPDALPVERSSNQDVSSIRQRIKDRLKKRIP